MVIISYLIDIRYSNELKQQQQQQEAQDTINFELYK